MSGSGDLAGHVRVVLDAGGAAGLPNNRHRTWDLHRPARSERERIVVSLAEAADYLRGVRVEADHPHVLDGEDARDLLGDRGEELLRRRLASDEGRGGYSAPRYRSFQLWTGGWW